MDWAAAVVCGIAGLLVGSFLHLLVARTPIHQPLRRPGLHCSNCGTAISGSRRIALVARVKGQARCTTCRVDLWPDSPGLELAATALLFVVGGRLGFAWALPAYLVFFLALLVVTVVDLRHYLIPNRVVYPALFSCLGLLLLASVLHWEFRSFWEALLGMALAWLFFFIVWFAYPRGMGFGDVRLSALIGLLAGWIGLHTVILSVLLGLVFGAVSGLVLMLLMLRSRKDAIPFGPFLASGATTAILFGGPIVNWWLGSS